LPHFYTRSYFMRTKITEHIDLDRKFWPVEADEGNDPESIRTIFAFGLGQQLSWEGILKKDRVVILAEPGTGKTEEFRAVTKRLRMASKPAFFCRIELLQELEVRHSLDIGTAEEFDEWLNGNKEAYFFLDSVDEARLKSHAAFEIALRRFANTIGERLHRTKVFVSCRVSNWRATADLSLFLSHLPRPEILTMRENEEVSTEEAGQAYEEIIPTDRSIDSKEKKDHVVFQLAPLNDQQIRHFAAQKGIDDAKEFIDAIERSDAGIFAERPQDLLVLIAYWKSNGHLGRHAEMLDFNIKVKLGEHDQIRDALKPLSSDDALFGAERLAAAITLQRKTAIILPDRPIDADLRAVSIEPKESLPDWSSDKIQTLLDRAIFDEAVYGTVRFHVREVCENLVAKWLKRLITEGKSRRSIEGLIFAQRYGRDVIIPSMRPIAAWLALWDERVRNRLRKIAPEILIENGDPSVLPIEFRESLLIGFAELYAECQYTGTSFDITMVRRLADPQLASTVNELLKKYASHDDICALLLRLIWQGPISESTNAALSFAIDDQTSSYIRICAIRAVAAAGITEQHAKLVNTLLADTSELNLNILGEVCGLFFPDILSVSQLLKILKNADPPERYSSSQLQQSIEDIANTIAPDKGAEKLLRGLHKLLKSQPFIERRHCEISVRYAWLLPSAIRVANQFIQKKHDFPFDPIVLDLFRGFLAAQDFIDFSVSDGDKIIEDAKAWPEFRYQLFWHAIAAARDREKDSKKHPTGWWQVRWELHDFWVPGTNDLEQLFEDLIHKPLIEDRIIVLTAIFAVYVDEGRPRKLRERMKRTVAVTPELEAKLHALLHPRPLPEEDKKWRRQERSFKQKRIEYEKRQKTNRMDWQQALRKKPEEIKNVGNAQEGKIWQRTAYLYDRIREKKDESEHGLGYSNWRVLIDEFGFDVSKNFRDGCVAYWRNYDPLTYPNRLTSKSIPWPRIIGLTGIAMEAADDPDWAKKITREEATLAAHYSVCELSEFPVWFKELYSEFPDLVDTVIKDELRWELHESPKENTFPHTLSALKYGDKEFNKHFKSTLFDLLSEQEPANDLVLDHTLSLILEGDLNTAFKKKLAELTCERFKAASVKKRKITWLIVLLCFDGIRGCDLLKKWIKDLPSTEEQKETMIDFCAALTDHGGARFGLTVRDYERIEVLGELMPLIYQFVKVEEDARHEDAYSPDIRDHAERTRSHLLNVIFDTPGRPSYDVLMNLSKTISYSFSKDRMGYLARERAALDAEFEPWSGSEVAEFAALAEKQPRTEADLYELALARLDDLKIDIEDGDESEAALLQKLSKEPKLRVILANRLRKSSRTVYTVSSEEELADATQPDIRLNAPQISAPVPVELKIADKWTLAKLRERMENQLIGQYMRVSQYGIFLVVHNGEKKSKHWKDNNSQKMVDFAGLVGALKQSATDLIRKYPNVADLEVVGIDFTVR
jgi:hypothetical protein